MCHLCEQLSKQLHASTKDHSALFRQLIDGKRRERDWLEQQRANIDIARGLRERLGRLCYGMAESMAAVRFHT